MNTGTVTSLFLKPLLYLLSFVFPRDPTIWTFSTDVTGRFAENPKYLFLDVNERFDDIRPIWIGDDPETVARLRRNGYEAYSPDSWKGRYYALRSKFVFLSHSLHFWEYTGGATVVQMWHGNALKRLGNDLGDEPSPLLKLYQRLIGKNWDEFAVTSDGAAFLPFASAHGIDRDDAMVSGYPRTDTLFRELEGERIGPNAETYEEIESLSEEATVVAYMPTYRRAFGNEDGQVIDDSWLELSALNETLTEANAHFLMKFHPRSTVAVEPEAFDRIHLLPEKLDVYPALKHVDVLVTDYSSIFFDYLLLDRPLLLYPKDRDEYEAQRGFYFDYEEITPGPKARTPEELNEQLEQLLAGGDEYADDRRHVRNLFYEHADGFASERVYNHVKDEYDT